MADDADRATELEQRLLAGRAGRDAEAPTVFLCGRRASQEFDVPRVQVLAAFLDRWLELGWERESEANGKVLLAWRRGGQPMKPGGAR